MVVLIEHGLLILKIIIEQMIEDKPTEVLEGRKQIEHVERSF
jgi:hypothetical protein